MTKSIINPVNPIILLMISMGLITRQVEAVWPLVSKKANTQEEVKRDLVRANNQMYDYLINAETPQQFLLDSGRTAAALERERDHFCNTVPSNNNRTTEACVDQYEILMDFMAKVSASTSTSTSTALASSTYNGMWSSSDRACRSEPGRRMISTRYYAQMCKNYGNQIENSREGIYNQLAPAANRHLKTLKLYNKVKNSLNASQRAQAQKNLQKEINKINTDIKKLEQERKKLRAEELTETQRLRLQSVEKEILSQEKNKKKLENNLKNLNHWMVKSARRFAHVFGLDALFNWITTTFTNVIYIMITVFSFGLIGAVASGVLLKYLIKVCGYIIRTLIDLVLLKNVPLKKAYAWAIRTLQGSVANYFAYPERRNQQLRNLRAIQNRVAGNNNNAAGQNRAAGQTNAAGQNRAAGNNNNAEARQAAHDLMYLSGAR